MWFSGQDFAMGKAIFNSNNVIEVTLYVDFPQVNFTFLRSSSSGDEQLIRGFGNYPRNENAQGRAKHRNIWNHIREGSIHEGRRG